MRFQTVPEYQQEIFKELFDLVTKGSLTDMGFLVEKSPPEPILNWLQLQTETGKLSWTYDSSQDTYYCQEYQFKFVNSSGCAKVFYKDKEFFVGFPIGLFDALFAHQKEKWFTRHREIVSSPTI